MVRGCHERISERGKPQPELIGAQRRRRSPVRKEVELTLLDAVFHLAARAIDCFVKLFRFNALAFERGHNEARVGSFYKMLRLGHDPALAAPAFAGLISQLLEDALRFAAFFRLQRSFGQFLRDPGFKPWIAGKAEDIVDVIILAPRHQLFTAKPGIRPEPDFDARPACPDLRGDPGDLVLGARRCVDIRGPQLGEKQLPAAENIKLQIAIALVIAVEEPAFLIAVDGSRRSRRGRG
jgi:hypothetical protein